MLAVPSRSRRCEQSDRAAYLSRSHLAFPRKIQYISRRLAPLLLNIPRHGRRRPKRLRPLDEVSKEVQPRHAAFARIREVTALLFRALVLVAPAPLILCLRLVLPPGVGVADIDPGNGLAGLCGRRGKPGKEGLEGLSELPGVGTALIGVVEVRGVRGLLLGPGGERGGFTVFPPFFGIELLDSAREVGCDLLVA